MAFSKDFLWGGDISAAQCEGAWNEDGKGPTEVDFMLGGDKDHPRMVTYKNADGTPGETPAMITAQLPKGAKYAILDDKYYPNHKAIDHYHHMEEDIRLFGEMGFKALNLTISWARVFPKGLKNGVNQPGLDFYRRELEACHKYGIEPIVTLYKYDMPVYYIEEMGGWSNRALVDEFAGFARTVMTEYRDLVKYWITFNEINILLTIGSYVKDYNDQDAFTQLHHQLLASARAVKIGHEISSDFKVGSMNAGLFNYPLTPDPADVIATQKSMQDKMFYSGDVQARGYYPSYSQRIWQEHDVQLSITPEDEQILRDGKVDFFAFSYYFTNCTTTHTGAETTAGNLSFGAKNPYLSESKWGWQIDPTGFKYALEMLYDRYQMPILVVENGLGAYDKLNDDKTIDDPYHIEYLGQHIAKMKEAVEEGVDLLGYTMWSCIDLCAASTGEVSKRYGFVYVDVDNDGKGTFNRYKKDSFYWYRQVIASNGEKLALLKNPSTK